jgi:Skp family chaperone for outer membrane proteins
VEIAVININRLLDDSERGQKLGQGIKVAVDHWRARLAELEAKIEKARQLLAKISEGSSAIARFNLQRDAQAAELELRHAQEMSHFEIESKREQGRITVLAELEPVIKQVVAEKNLLLVLMVPSREVAYAAASVDLTNELIARYDKIAR